MNNTVDQPDNQRPFEKVILFFARLLIRMTLAIGAWQIRNAGGRMRHRSAASIGLGAIYLLADALGVVVHLCWGVQAGSESSKRGGTAIESCGIT